MTLGWPGAAGARAQRGGRRPCLPGFSAERRLSNRRIAGRRESRPSDRRHSCLRALRAFGVLGVALLLTGCVYLRLLEVKRQLAQFDRHFAVQTNDGIKIICQTPVLTMDDVRWIGLPPETKRQLGRAEQWHVSWVKQLPRGVTEKGSYHIALDLGFADGKLSSISIPERYFGLLPKDFVLGVIKSLGGAKVDKSSKTAEAAVDAQKAALAQPSMPDIGKLLGQATETRVEGRHTIDRYRYVPASKEGRGGVFEMTLRFDTKTGDLLHWHGRTPMGSIAFSFGK